MRGPQTANPYLVNTSQFDIRATSGWIQLAIIPVVTEHGGRRRTGTSDDAAARYGKTNGTHQSITSFAKSNRRSFASLRMTSYCFYLLM
jgi:hypothetical protein